MILLLLSNAEYLKGLYEPVYIVSTCQEFFRVIHRSLGHCNDGLLTTVGSVTGNFRSIKGRLLGSGHGDKIDTLLVLEWLHLSSRLAATLASGDRLAL